MTESLRVLELYSGIGGMHYALKESKFIFKIVAAVDVNDVANAVYKHNFEDTVILQRSIEALTVENIDKMDIDMLVMSPPCQPFCRAGRQRGAFDKRTVSFMHIMDILPDLHRKPNYILMENVFGFEKSDCREMLVEVLGKADYVVQEFLLSPVQFGIPNSRLRYYLLAKLKPLRFCFPFVNQICIELLKEWQIVSPMNSSIGSETNVCNLNLLNKEEAVQCELNYPDTRQCATNHSSAILNTKLDTVEKNLPCEQCNNLSASVQSACNEFSDFNESCASKKNETTEKCYVNDDENIDQPLIADIIGPLYKKYELTCKQLSDYLEQMNENVLDKYRVSDKVLSRYLLMDIVVPDDRHSCCFTKGYGHHIEGAGSFLAINAEARESLGHVIRSSSCDVLNADLLNALSNLKLRYFSPREIANLMCFPPEFYVAFYPDINTR